MKTQSKGGIRVSKSDRPRVPLDQRPPFGSRQMEGTLALLDSSEELLPHHVNVAIVGKFEIVDTSHDARQIIVRRVGWLAGLAHHREHRRQALEA